AGGARGPQSARPRAGQGKASPQAPPARLPPDAGTASRRAARADRCAAEGRDRLGRAAARTGAATRGGGRERRGCAAGGEGGQAGTRGRRLAVVTTTRVRN